MGLYTAFVPMALRPWARRARSVSTTTTRSTYRGRTGHLATDGSAPQFMSAAATLALLTGGFLVLASILRWASSPISFRAGADRLQGGHRLVIVVDQLPKMMGAFRQRGFFTNLLSTGQHLPASSVPTLIVALATMAIVILVGKFSTDCRRHCWP